MLLIDDLLLWLPMKGFLGIFEKIHEMAERELHDEAYLQEKLLELQLGYELGEIGEEEYSQKGKELIARLNAIRGIGEGEEARGKDLWDSKAAA
ncbi:MAG: gas vesicle protein GvpG [Candidatus Methylomirabilales bacterium]